VDHGAARVDGVSGVAIPYPGDYAGMKSRSRFLIGVCLGAVCGLAAGGVTIATGDHDDDPRYEARAEIFGPPGSGIRGEARFRQESSTEDQPTPVIEVDVVVRGLPREPRERAFHVHEFGTCGPPFTAAGGHFDAGPAKNTEPESNHPYHLGDLPELERQGRTFRMHGATTRFVLQPAHPTTIFDSDGASVIVHQLEDRGDVGPPGRPGPPGSAGGGRDACGVIQMDDDDDGDDD
jgi:Cu-Zn family superoxide dismutase